MDRQQVQVLLHDVEGPVNLGSVCRAMANTGFSRLAYSGGLTGQEDDARRFAVHASAILDNARRCATLDELVSNADIVVGLSPRSPWRDGLDIELERLPEVVASSQSGGRTVGLLFGNEARGLSNDELSVCRYRLSLPSDDGYVSLNLSHAVMVTLWELHRAGADVPAASAPAPEQASSTSRRVFLSRFRELLDMAGYLDPQNPHLIWQELSLLFESRDWSIREMELLTGAVNRCRREMKALLKKRDEMHP